MKPTSLDRILAQINNDAWRRQAYRDIRQHWKGVHALCAATASWTLKAVGLLNSYDINCEELTKHLLRNRWVKGYGWADIKPGCLCFMQDANHNGASDHVVIFIRWLDFDKRVGEVFDNQAVDPHPRNLGNALVWRGLRLSRLSFWYCVAPSQ